MVVNAAEQTTVRIDAHQHFWIYNRRDYTWMSEKMDLLRRDYLPPDLAPLLARPEITSTIAVQARQSVEETEWLLQLADQTPFIRGVVGWVDLLSPRLDEQLEKFSQHPRLVGVRHVVHDEPDDRFMARDDFLRGVGRLRKLGLTYDLLLFPRHLSLACEVVQRFPDQPFVLDHISKPLIKDHQIEPWASDLRRLAQFDNVFCKISGMVTEADWNRWQAADLTPYLDIVLECFGTKRLMVGSDWPVCTLAGRYETVLGVTADYLAQLSSPEQADIWHYNAERFYRIQL